MGRCCAKPLINNSHPFSSNSPTHSLSFDMTLWSTIRVSARFRVTVFPSWRNRFRCLRKGIQVLKIADSRTTIVAEVSSSWVISAFSLKNERSGAPLMT